MLIHAARGEHCRGPGHSPGLSARNPGLPHPRFVMIPLATLQGRIWKLAMFPGIKHAAPLCVLIAGQGPARLLCRQMHLAEPRGRATEPEHGPKGCMAPGGSCLCAVTLPGEPSQRRESPVPRSLSLPAVPGMPALCCSSCEHMSRGYSGAASGLWCTQTPAALVLHFQGHSQGWGIT